MAGVERLAVELEVALILIEETVEPGEELLGAVVGVEDDGDTVGGGDAADVVGSGDTTGDGRVLAVVADTLTGEESSTTVGDLEDDGGLVVTGSLEGGDDDGRGGDVLHGLVFNSSGGGKVKRVHTTAGMANFFS